MDEQLLRPLMLYKSVSAIWWGVWAMIQHTVSQIDFDYMEWGLERIGARREGRGRPRLPAVAGGTVKSRPAYAAKGGTA